MSPKLRILLGAAPTGPWSRLADCFLTAGAEVISAPATTGDLVLPEDWVPDAVVTLPQSYESGRFDLLDMDVWMGAQAAELGQRFALSQLVARMMSAGPGGLIVHVVDDRFLPGSAEHGGGMIASFATAGLSRGTALDLKDKHRCNTLAVTPTAENLAALVQCVLHFCSAEGRSISGQIARISADRVQLFSQPRPVRVAHSDGPWSDIALAEQVAEWAEDLPQYVLGAGR